MPIPTTTTRATAPPGRRRPAALAVALALALTACGGGDDDAVTDDPGDGVTSETADDSTASETADDGAASETTDDGADDGADGAAGDPPVTTAESEFGEILVTADGSTVYGFTQDEQGGASACTEACLATWPPVLLDGDTLPDGLDASVFGVLTREDDGSHQLTADGWPLYTYAPDAGPGDTTGQGVGDVWWVVAPDGTLVTDGAEDASADLGY